ncbi:hypothetical protein Mro03_51510 [Microbispora rosea subsp. rosea]|nr:hypothetical protein Mro03_51510 [Microbispora rosea subsp. rosea]
MPGVIVDQATYCKVVIKPLLYVEETSGIETGEINVFLGADGAATSRSPRTRATTRRRRCTSFW